MLEPLAGRAIRGPVLLVLLELLEALEHEDEGSAAAHQPRRCARRRRDRDRRRRNDLADLEQLEPTLVELALRVVPGDLVLEPLPRRRAGRRKLAGRRAFRLGLDGLALLHASLL